MDYIPFVILSKLKLILVPLGKVMSRRFTGGERSRICELFRSGQTLERIALQFNCQYPTIRSVLIKDLGWETYRRIAKSHQSREQRQFSVGEKQTICRLFESGKNIYQISKKFESSFYTIKKLLVSELGEERYNEIVEEHRENSKKTQFKPGHAVPREWVERRIEAVREHGLSEEHKRHISQSLKGIKRDEKWLAKHRGSNHWNWKGGISKSESARERYGMSINEWKALAQRIRKRDNFTCQWCGRRRATVVHHIVPIRVRLDNHPDNLITLCRCCHPEVEALTDEYLEQGRVPVEVFFDRWQG